MICLKNTHWQARAVEVTRILPSDSLTASLGMEMLAVEMWPRGVVAGVSDGWGVLSILRGWWSVVEVGL